MGRFIIGCIAASLAMFVLGFIFFATPLQMLGYATASHAANASVQNAMAAHLPTTGTYKIPTTSSAEGTALYGRGPIATIHYNTRGFSVADPGMMVAGYIHMLLTAVIMGLALLLAAGRVGGFAGRARLVIYLTLAASLFINLRDPIWYHHDWTFAAYRFIADLVILAIGGLVIARWFLPPATSAEHL